jgi:hypothetical protein
VSTTEAIRRLTDESEIRSVIYRYCRGVDRRQYDLIRSCYHDDAMDSHGIWSGNVDDFIRYVAENLPRYENTLHFIGNIGIEINGDRARTEAYTLAFHRLAPSGERPARDYVVALRYVDDFERRKDEWRIANRVCVYEFTRTDPVPPGWTFPADVLRGQHGPADVVFRAGVTAG